MPLDFELVWDDRTAPETAIDFESPDMSLTEIFASWGVVVAALYGLYALVSWYSPETIRPVAPRSVVLDQLEIQYDAGLLSKEEYESRKSLQSE